MNTFSTILRRIARVLVIGAAGLVGASEAPPTSRPASFATDFDQTENPISERGRWRRADNGFTNVRTENGVAHGTNGNADAYDDSYSLLSGFDADVRSRAVIQRSEKSIKDVTHEVELLLRFADDKDGARGYECLFSHDGGVQIVRWNGKMGDYAVLKSTEGPERFARQLKSGDVVEASIVGDEISLRINDTLVARTRDATYNDGQPGIGFFTRPRGNSADFCVTRYEVTAAK